MTSPKESGHEINVANLDYVIESVSGFGKDFNPAKTLLAIPSLKGMSVNCKQANTDVLTKVSAYKSAVDDREAAFEKLRTLLIRVGNSMVVSDLSPENISTAREMLRKAQGRRAASGSRALVKTDVTGEKRVSVSQMGYDNQLKNVAQVVSFLSTKNYKPNEPDLRSEALQGFLEELKKKNAAVISAKSALADARILRNELMYKEGTGLVSVALDVKSYVKSVFGPSSPQFKKITGIKFTRP